MLEVEAHLEDGRVIKGELDPVLADGDPAKEIRIPRRSSQSKIATSWKQANRATDLPDDDDSDKTPEGKPGADGDGLSLYEEYRGFFADGEHVSTDPAKKDLFVVNDCRLAESRAITRKAIDRFESISGLKIRDVRPGEMFLGRKNGINLNRQTGPTVGPQAGLWLRDTLSRIHAVGGRP